MLIMLASPPSRTYPIQVETEQIIVEPVPKTKKKKKAGAAGAAAPLGVKPPPAAGAARTAEPPSPTKGKK